VGRLFEFLKPYWYFILLSPLAMAVEVFMDLLQPLYMQRIVDEGIAMGDMVYVKAIMIKMFIVAAIGYAGGVGCSYFSTKAAVYVGTDLRNSLFKKIMSLSYGNVDRLDSGKLITRLTSDVVQVQRALLMSLRLAIRAPLQIIGSVIITYMISPKLFRVILFLIPVLIVSIIVIIKFGQPLFKKVQKSLDNLNTVVQEGISGIRVIKAFVRGDFEKKRFNEVNEDYIYKGIRANSLTALMNPISMVLVNGGIVAVLWLSGYEVKQNGLEVGKVLAFVNYLLLLLNSLMMLANLMMLFTRAQASLERIFEVLDSDPDIKEMNDAMEVDRLEGALVFDHVTFSYSDHTEPVLKDISFIAKKGEKLAIIGSTGSGKSSLVKLIPRLYDVDEGSISIGGVDICNFQLKSLRSRIVIVLQQAILFSGSIYSNIIYGKDDASKDKIIEVSESVQAKEFIDMMPEGFETKLGQRGVNLSGGQKQRLSIARGMIMKPDILIMDDSTSAIDVVTEKAIQSRLKKKMKGTTVIMVAQRISSVLDADRILVMENGMIVGNGTHEELIKDNDVYRDIYESQLGKAGEEYAG
jgi:ATP-binding cassette subfamily B protein